jgi:dipeptidase
MLRLRSLTTLITLIALIAAPAPARACTNILVTRGASTDGSTQVTYAADSHVLYGELYFYPAKVHRKGATRRVVDWDSGKYIRNIPEARKTYQVVGNMNAHQLVIGETTYGGRKELTDAKNKGIDYGSLMYIALQRARTAREAITVMTSLVAKYGYSSSGEVFSIADPREVWLMDMIGKGKGRKGAVWVARKVPDGYISAHANQTRIRRFPQNDPESCRYAKDVISFAREKGYFSGADKDFSFSDTYAPMTFRALRIREARVWSIFRRAAPSLKLSEDYILGKPGAKPLPLWIKPDRKLSVADTAALMRDHFDGTRFDLRKGVGVGPYRLPYRWRPLTWKVKGKKYLNERAISTQQTGFSFISQSRAWLPAPVGGVLWFGVDDTASTVYVPIYAGVRKAPLPFAVGNGSFKEFSWSSAFWVFNWVSNFAYSRYDAMIKEIRAVQQQLEGGFFTAQPGVERKALALHKRSPAAARAFLTRYSAALSDRVLARWRKLGEQLLLKFLDGNVRDAKGEVQHPGYPKAWYRRIVAERGEHFRLRRLPGEPAPDKGKKGKKAKKTGSAKKKPACKKPAPGAPRRPRRAAGGDDGCPCHW